MRSNMKRRIAGSANCTKIATTRSNRGSNSDCGQRHSYTLAKRALAALQARCLRGEKGVGRGAEEVLVGAVALVPALQMFVYQRPSALRAMPSRSASTSFSAALDAAEPSGRQGRR